MTSECGRAIQMIDDTCALCGDYGIAMTANIFGDPCHPNCLKEWEEEWDAYLRLPDTPGQGDSPCPPLRGQHDEPSS